MSLATPNCPICQAALVLTHSGELDSWVCPAHHGVAMTLSEAYGIVQDDEIHLLWDLARAQAAGPSGRPSPMTGRPMVSVSVPYDADETPGVEAAAGLVVLDVDLDEEVIWFDLSELEVLPADLPNAEPSAEELTAVNEIRRRYGEAIIADSHENTSHELAERVHGAFSKLFTKDHATG
jgi:hypothetical protein